MFGCCISIYIHNCDLYNVIYDIGFLCVVNVEDFNEPMIIMMMFAFVCTRTQTRPTTLFVNI